MNKTTYLKYGSSLLIFLCLVVLFFLMGIRFGELRNLLRGYRSDCRFSAIKRMLQIYHDRHGSFPPTKYTHEASGQIHSWRVLLVPHSSEKYLDKDLFYDYSQAWNSSNNNQVFNDMTDFAFFSMAENPKYANYLAVGDGDVWPSEEPLKSLLVTKGSNRFLVVEYPDSKIHWMEPKY